MARSPGKGGGKVPDEELAEIARQLRGALAETETGALPASPEARRPARARIAVGSRVVLLRLVAGFVLPGLILMAIALLGGLTG